MKSCLLNFLKASPIFFIIVFSRIDFTLDLCCNTFEFALFSSIRYFFIILYSALFESFRAQSKGNFFFRCYFFIFLFIKLLVTTVFFFISFITCDLGWFCTLNDLRSRFMCIFLLPELIEVSVLLSTTHDKLGCAVSGWTLFQLRSRRFAI